MLARLANVNKDEITSKTRQALFLIANFCGSADVTTDGHVSSDGNLYPLVVHLFLKDLGTEEKREGFIF